MNQILINTRKRSNIELLRARDFWFNKARRWGWMATALSFVPIVLTAVSYFPIPGYIEFFDATRDIIVGLVALGFFGLCIPIENQSNRYREVSNLFREEYDVNVLGIPRNPFIHDEFSAEQQRMLEEGARKYRDHQKYEAWYEEVFSDNHYANVICCQMDNVLYTLYVYREAISFYWVCTALLIAVIIAPSLIFQSTEALVLVLVSAFGLLTACIQSIREMREQVSILNDMCAVFHVSASKETDSQSGYGQAPGCPLLDLDDPVACNLFIREVQDAVAGYRAVGAFIPRFIRLKYLREDSPFYKDLNKIKGCLYAGRKVTRPETAEQILIHNESETALFHLSQVQDILRKMLADVVAVFDANGITYTLDGGSLIGAVRENEHGHFVFWDDDVDLALPVSELERAKDVLRAALGDAYDIQDYENDLAYSPRLSNFRIRHRGSVTAEKDSLLYENYRFRGVFIDVYAYTPLLVNEWVDSFYRRLLLHPLNKRILRAENKAVERAAANERLRSAEFRRFTKLKDRYLRRVAWYVDHAHDDSYVTYVPTYIYDMSQCGPYIPRCQMEPAPEKVCFEGIPCSVPANYDEVLKTYYGSWKKVPFRTIEQMREVAKEKGPDMWFSEFVQAVTPLKHIRNVEIHEVSTQGM